MFSFFNDLTTFELYTILLTSGIVVLTLVYAYFTYALFSESRKMREIQTNPRLSVYLMCDSHSIRMKNLVVKNIGLGPAYDIKFKLSSDFTLFDGKQLSEIHFIKTGIPYMPPRYDIQFLMTDFDYPKYADISFVITIKYQNSLKQLFEEDFVIDFSLWKNLTNITPKGLPDVVEELKNINRNLEKIIQK